MDGQSEVTAQGAASNHSAISIDSSPLPSTSSSPPATSNGKRNHLEIIEDPSALLSEPFVRYEEAATRAVEDAEEGHAAKARKVGSGSSSAGETSRKLPSGFINGGSAASNRNGSTRPSKGSAAKIFQPPPRPASSSAASSSSSRPNGNRHAASDIPTITGSGARVPTAFLDDKGGFSREAVAASSNPSSETERPLPSTAPSSRANGVKRERGAIDFTNDSDDDDVTVVATTKADTGVEVDESRSSAPVCIGLVRASLMAIKGMPSICRLEPGQTSSPMDGYFTKAQWPAASHFWTQSGWRPVLLSIGHANAMGQIRGGGPTEKQIQVSTVLAPALVHQRAVERAVVTGMPPPDPKDAIPRIQSAFGYLTERVGRILTTLLETSAIRCEARVPTVGANRAQLFMHEIEILVFTTRSNMATISNILAGHGIALSSPGVYDPKDYPGQPELVNLNQGTSHGAHGASGSLYQGSAYGSVMQTKELTEQERKRQVDTVYDSLRGGEDLAQVEPDDRVSTPLFPHQKQALAFLLDREKERKFAEVKLPDAGDSSSATNGKVDKGKGKGTADDDDENEIISLWQAKRNSQGKIRNYYNVVTQSSTAKKPYLTRGAILADDMGLGKTISTIALIASTMDEAAAFAKNKIRKQKTSPVSSPGDETPPTPTPAQPEVLSIDDGSDDDDILVIAGAPPLSAAAAAKSKSKAKKPKEDAETTRRKNLVVRSRATLIVLPLTLLSGWEDQLREHWTSERPPSCYVYHGPSRKTDPVEVADHDIVITTYSTLGTEFSNQRSWVDDDGDDSDDGESSATATSKKKRKGRGRAESPNTLQKIDWFRVVLDEAHSIKEPRTHQSRAVCNLTAQRRLALTGTPVQNRIDDLYALIKFLRLEPFTDRAIWNAQCGGGDNNKRGQLASRKDKADVLDDVAMAKVQTIMKFLTLRRTKETKQKDGTKLLSLPPKSSRIVSLEFDKHEAARYGIMHSRYKEDFETMKASDTLRSNYATILHEISNLRMTCDHPALVDESKDLKRHKEGQSLELAIEEYGITKARAIELFSILAQSDGARCAACDVDLTGTAEDGVATDAKPVLTQCKHLVCSDCFATAMQGKWPDASSEDRGPCPACDVVLGPLVEAVQLEPQDIDAGEGGGEDIEGFDDDDDDDPGLIRRGRFGADGLVPVPDRADLSTKIRALLADLVPFSKCNPNSILYDREAPVLDQVPASELKLASGDEDKTAQEPVVIKQLPPGTAEAKKIKPIKSVVFSQWTKMLDHVHQSLYRAGIKDARLDGRMNRQERAAHLERFKSDPSVEVLLVSLKAGGIGLNLVSACRAYLLEPYWNPATENQGLDRIHRLGQVRPVITTKYVIKNSIETAMLEIQRRKMLLAQRVGERRGATSKEIRDQELTLLFGATGAPKTAEEEVAEKRAAKNKKEQEASDSMQV